MVDEHTRESLLHLVERSITAERLVAEPETVFTAAGGPPKVLRMDNGPELVSQALQLFCEGKVGLSYIPPGTPWNNGELRHLFEQHSRYLARTADDADLGALLRREPGQLASGRPTRGDNALLADSFETRRGWIKT